MAGWGIAHRSPRSTCPTPRRDDAPGRGMLRPTYGGPVRLWNGVVVDDAAGAVAENVTRSDHRPQGVAGAAGRIGRAASECGSHGLGRLVIVEIVAGDGQA